MFYSQMLDCFWQPMPKSKTDDHYHDDHYHYNYIEKNRV